MKVHKGENWWSLKPEGLLGYIKLLRYKVIPSKGDINQILHFIPHVLNTFQENDLLFSVVKFPVILLSLHIKLKITLLILA